MPLYFLFFLKLVFQNQNLKYKVHFNISFFLLFLFLLLLECSILFIIILTDNWREPSARKLFFEKYAKGKGFDPLHPENWYMQTYDNIIAEKVQ